MKILHAASDLDIHCLRMSHAYMGKGQGNNDIVGFTQRYKYTRISFLNLAMF